MSCLAPRTALGLRPAISVAATMASATGSLESLVTTPNVAPSLAGKMRPVLWAGVVDDPAALPALVAPSLYKSPRWRDALAAAAASAEVDPEVAARETDPADHGEGLYLKVEDADHVLARYKWVRASFLTSVLDSGSHWLARPIVPNQLAADVDLFAPEPP